MESGAPTLIHDGPHLQALVRKGSSPYVLVTFNGRTFRADGKRIWAQPVVEKLDLNAVGFVTKAPNWFPEADLAEAIAAVRPFIEGFDKRIGYGYSQGAYAAIKVSRPLGLTRTIAVSPQWSIDPADIVDDRYNRFFDADLNRAMAIGALDAPESLMILYDAGLAIDDQHIRHIQSAVPDASVVRMPFTSHDTIRAIQGSEAFRELLASLDDGSVVATISRLRRASMIRHETMIYRAVTKRQFARALAILEAAPLNGDGRTGAYLWFAQHGGAEVILRNAIKHAAARPEDAMAWAVYAFVLLSVEKTKRAKEAALYALTQKGTGRARSIAKITIARCDRAMDR